ncbi:ribosome-associated protein [Sphingomonas sp. YR710]|jgi:ribosome-associated protein|uniref:alternative ribosome rescue aminoacyl-tRNA hydrolase ArfB n=1 Tax=Sphingomonas sp. YR710 TaxID=1882773 RepID=UPI000890D1AD|nr:alternative ribosome rescue aminoacyl-tRNA hydrolase ArfB [Sphingomonas sp. YR710]SDD56809.1 ribosome-associated protein [Sphingomonas sp. YR710]
MVLIPVTRSISIDSDEIEESFTRASGPGGQHVNTTDSAVLLRFNVWASPNLPDMVKHRLSDLAGSRLTNDGVLVLRSEGARSQLMNRTEVRERLIAMIKEATIVPKKRKPTRPSKTAKAKRMDGKAKRSTVKNLRGKVRD